MLAAALFALAGVTTLPCAPATGADVTDLADFALVVFTAGVFTAGVFTAGGFTAEISTVALFILDARLAVGFAGDVDVPAARFTVVTLPVADALTPGAAVVDFFAAAFAVGFNAAEDFVFRGAAAVVGFSACGFATARFTSLAFANADLPRGATFSVERVADAVLAAVAADAGDRSAADLPARDFAVDFAGAGSAVVVFDVARFTAEGAMDVVDVVDVAAPAGAVATVGSSDLRFLSVEALGVVSLEASFVARSTAAAVVAAARFALRAASCVEGWLGARRGRSPASMPIRK